MLFFGKPLSDVNEQDLLNLVGSAHESKTLDFKSALPERNHKGNKGYLADISAFANASGGFIIYGMEEIEGVASKLIGLDVKDIDQEIQGLNNRAEQNIKPRIANRNLKQIHLGSEKFALIESIPKSLVSPHVVDYDGHWRFYSRNSSGNYMLEVDEVRSAILSSETLRERVRSFRMERLANVIAGETPVPLEQKPTVVFHIMPLASFSNPLELPFIEVSKRRDIEDVTGLNKRFNVDGFVGYRGNLGNILSYTQIFRNGIVEYVNIGMTSTNNNTKYPNYLSSVHFEKTLIKALSTFMTIFKDFAVVPPIILTLSLIGFKNHYMSVPRSIEFHYDNIVPLDRDNVLVPEIFLEDFVQSPEKILREIFDIVWNAAGWQGSLNYDKDGNWVPRSE
jgi:hypothetical protein